MFFSLKKISCSRYIGTYLFNIIAIEMKYYKISLQDNLLINSLTNL